MSTPLPEALLTIGRRVVFDGYPYTVRDIGRRRNGESIAWLHGLDECVPANELSAAPEDAPAV